MSVLDFGSDWDETNLLSPPVVAAKGIPRNTELFELSKNPSTSPCATFACGVFALVAVASQADVCAAIVAAQVNACAATCPNLILKNGYKRNRGNRLSIEAREFKEV